MSFPILNCVFCNEPLEELGGLLFSPPIEGGLVEVLTVVHKHHVCKRCYELLTLLLTHGPPNFGGVVEQLGATTAALLVLERLVAEERAEILRKQY